MKILITAKQTGSAACLNPIAKELENRGHDITIYATGNENEAAGFGKINYTKITPKIKNYSKLINGFDLIITGLSGYKTPDGQFIKAGNQAGIPTLAVLDQDKGYENRFGTELITLPKKIAIMNEKCKKTMETELKDKIKEEAIQRSSVIGWIAYDNFAEIKKNFTEQEKINLLKKINLTQEEEINIYFSQNVHPDSEYMKQISNDYETKIKEFLYDKNITERIFEAAADLKIKFFVKPHPGEEFKRNYTEELAKYYGITYIPAKACNTKELILASNSIVAGRSTCLNEACILDKKVAAILAQVDPIWLTVFPPIELNAIPYTEKWEEIPEILKLITTKNKKTNKKLSEKRKNFSTDGKAAKRLADIIENSVLH
jgi:hypothetical protein